LPAGEREDNVSTGEEMALIRVSGRIAPDDPICGAGLLSARRAAPCRAFGPHLKGIAPGDPPLSQRKHRAGAEAIRLRAPAEYLKRPCWLSGGKRRRESNEQDSGEVYPPSCHQRPGFPPDCHQTPDEAKQSCPSSSGPESPVSAVRRRNQRLSRCALGRIRTPGLRYRKPRRVEHTSVSGAVS